MTENPDSTEDLARTVAFLKDINETVTDQNVRLSDMLVAKIRQDGDTFAALKAIMEAFTHSEEQNAAESDTAQVVRVLGDIGLQYFRDRNQEVTAERERVVNRMFKALEGPLAALVSKYLGGKQEVIFKDDGPEVEVNKKADPED